MSSLNSKVVTSVLSNGLKLATQKTSQPVATIGLCIGKGVRHETDKTHGLTNVFEKLLCNNKKLKKNVDVLGGSIQGYYDRENLNVFVRTMASNAEVMTKSLADALDCENFTNQSVSDAKSLSLAKIKENNQNYLFQVNNYLHATAFQQTPLGRTLEGTTTRISELEAEDIKNYVNSLGGKDVAVVAVGNIEHDVLVKAIESKFKGLKNNLRTNRSPFCNFTGSEVRVRDDFLPGLALYTQMAFLSLPATDVRGNIILEIVDNLIGTYDWTRTANADVFSKLTRVITTDKSAYRIMPLRIAYSDTGLYGITIETHGDAGEHSLFEVQSAWLDICNNINDGLFNLAVNNAQINLLKKDACSYLRAVRIARDIFVLNEPTSINERLALIYSIKKEEVTDTLTEILYDKCPALAGMGATDLIQDYNRLRNNQFRLRT